jgi:presenilin-like A22 family membrane protease
MKHNNKVTIIILAMFLLTQFIGLFVINQYATEKIIDGELTQVNATKSLPYGMEIPETEETTYETNFISLLFSFIIAIALIFLLTRIRAKKVMKIWFFLVTIIALGLAFTAFLPSVKYASLIGLTLAVPLAIMKVYKRDFVAHNFSELLIYPGIAAVFVPLLNLTTMIILLVLISIYDMWAVWKSGIMQKMAKFQMDELKIFGGFLLPYASKKQKKKIKKIKQEIKEKKITKEEANKKSKMKINVAILGGGDVVFPIITAGVVLKTWGFWPALGVSFGALLGLGYLLIFSEKKKFYPAMPFISAGIFLSMLISWLIKVL